ncbi:MAG: hypothetical protein AB7O24_17475 [Kofleriaceae bacterium]
MRWCDAAVLLGVVQVAACGGGEDHSPREACLEAEAAINAAAKQCDPQHGSVDLSCSNFGTGSSCGVIDQ